MESRLVFLIVLLAFLWTAQPGIRKHLLGKYSALELICMEYSMYSLVVFGYGIYLYRQNGLSMLRRMDRNDLLSVSYLVCILTVSALIYATVIRGTDISVTIPCVQAVNIMFIAVMGYMMFNEDVDRYKLTGGLLMSTGIFFISGNAKALLSPVP